MKRESSKGIFLFSWILYLVSGHQNDCRCTFNKGTTNDYLV